MCNLSGIFVLFFIDLLCKEDWVVCGDIGWGGELGLRFGRVCMIVDWYIV